MSTCQAARAVGKHNTCRLTLPNCATEDFYCGHYCRVGRFCKRSPRGAVKLSPRKGAGEGSHRSERGRCAREVQR
eukprot:2574057-Prymnesium_polylepis.1